MHLLAPPPSTVSTTASPASTPSSAASAPPSPTCSPGPLLPLEVHEARALRCLEKCELDRGGDMLRVDAVEQGRRPGGGGAGGEHAPKQDGRGAGRRPGSSTTSGSTPRLCSSPTRLIWRD